jgi:3',5'-cyclic AMP phosphodiesterase CpdA
MRETPEVLPDRDPFVQEPYLQLGDSQDPASMMVLWHTEDAESVWSVEVAGSAGDPAPASQAVCAPETERHLVYRARLTGLVPGERFRYQVLRNGEAVFQSCGRARKSAAQPVRFALFGDCSHSRPVQREIARRAAQAEPDFILLAGDIVYNYGRISEYREKFFPVYSSAMRSIPFVAAPGNHDMVLPNFGQFADSLAYFLYWDQPLNGPRIASGAPGTSHVLIGNEAAQPAFLAAAAPRYPVMANYSFDYGNAHWTVLDSNEYMDWTNPGLRQWLRDDLAAAQGAVWRFVAFHHPGFSSSNPWFTDQWMRPVAPLLEAGKVDVVFSGHRHNYQRSVPLKFRPGKRNDKGEVPGEFELNVPGGVIYIVSGAGGAELYDAAQGSDRATWQPFTERFISDRHTFTLVDIEGGVFRLRQIADNGEVVDRFCISKQALPGG